MDNVTAHITSQCDSIHATLSTGELFIGTLDEITALLRSRGITAADITMPHKNDDESPTTGQRIAIYHPLNGGESSDIDAIRKRQDASTFAIRSVAFSGYVLDAWALEQHRRYVAGEITPAQMTDDVLDRYRLTKPGDE